MSAKKYAMPSWMKLSQVERDMLKRLASTYGQLDDRSAEMLAIEMYTASCFAVKFYNENRK